MIFRALSATTFDFPTILLSIISWEGDAGRLFNIPLLGVLLESFFYMKRTFLRYLNSRNNVNWWVSWCINVVLMLTLAGGDANYWEILFWLLQIFWVGAFWFPWLKRLLVFPYNFFCDISWDMSHLLQIHINIRIRVSRDLQRAVSAAHHKTDWQTHWADTMLAMEFKMMTASCQPEYIFIDTFGIMFKDYPLWF